MLVLTNGTMQIIDNKYKILTKFVFFNLIVKNNN